MKYDRILIALLLAVTLILPAVAQQPSSPDSKQPAASSTQNSSTDLSQNPPAQAQGQPATSDQNTGSARQPLQPQTREGFWGRLNPFARKKYVQRQLGPVRDRVNELDELTAANGKQLRDVDSRAQEGIRVASAKANEADTHAVDAGNRAQVAQQTAQQAHTRLQTVEQAVGSFDQYQTATQAEIRFRSGQVALSQKAKQALDEIAQPLKDQKGYIVEVQGFSPGRGQASIQNSQQMADSVVRYLVLNHDIPVHRIFVVGMGNAPVPATTEGGKPQRIRGGRVEVGVMKNNLSQLASQQPLATPAPSGSATPSGQGGVSGTATTPSQTPAPSAGSSSQQPSGNISAPTSGQPVAPKPESQAPKPQAPR